MKKQYHNLTVLCAFFILFNFIPNSFSYSQITIPTPDSHFGFFPGTDKMLFNYEELDFDKQKKSLLINMN